VLKVEDSKLEEKKQETTNPDVDAWILIPETN